MLFEMAICQKQMPIEPCWTGCLQQHCKGDKTWQGSMSFFQLAAAVVANSFEFAVLNVTS